MTTEIKIFLCVWAVNFLISIIYFDINCFKKPEKRKPGYVIRTILMILCPIVGPLFFLISYVLYKIFMSDPVDLEDVIFSKEKVKSYVRPDEERERNTVSLEEAVEIMDKDNLRTTMMSVVSGDNQKSLATISLALNSSDSETSHYAASVMVDALNEFRKNVDNQYKLMTEESQDGTKIGEMLMDYMNKILIQKVFTDIEQKDYVDKMDEVGEFIFGKNAMAFTPAYYENLAMRLLEVKDFEKCEKWCERLQVRFPETLASFTCRLKLYFEKGEKNKFFKVISELKQSSVVIDRETLEMIRIFM